MRLTVLLYIIYFFSKVNAFSSGTRGGSKTPLQIAEEQQHHPQKQKQQKGGMLRQKYRLDFFNALEAQSMTDYLEVEARCSNEELQNFQLEYKRQIKASLIRS